MTREEAAGLVAAHFKTHKVHAHGLDAQGRAGALVAGEQLLFEHLENGGVLRCSALIYRWREWPKPGLLEALRQEAQSGASNTGGATLHYVPEHRTLSLSQEFAQTPSPATFEQAMTQLREDCSQWRTEVFARVAEKVLHPSGT